MEAWRKGLFEDDAALDILDELIEMDQPMEFIKDSINVAILKEYLEYDECFAVIISAVLIDSIVNATEYDTLINDYEELLTVLENEKFGELKEKAIKALNIVISNSELIELWEEDEAEYSVQLIDINEIILRLS